MRNREVTTSQISGAPDRQFERSEAPLSLRVRTRFRAVYRRIAFKKKRAAVKQPSDGGKKSSVKSAGAFARRETRKERFPVRSSLRSSEGECDVYTVDISSKKTTPKKQKQKRQKRTTEGEGSCGGLCRPRRLCVTQQVALTPKTEQFATGCVSALKTSLVRHTSPDR